MNVILSVQQETARQLHDHQFAARDAAEIWQATHQLGVNLTPLFPHTTETSLIPYFAIEAQNMEIARHIIESLQQCHAIQSIYLKPQSHTPQKEFNAGSKENIRE